MTHRGSFQPLPFCDSVKRGKPLLPFATLLLDKLPEKHLVFPLAQTCKCRAGFIPMTALHS